MVKARTPRIALLWEHLSPHHADRCRALAERMGDRAEVLAIEVAAASQTYPGWPSAEDAGAAHMQTLFPGRLFEDVSRWRRFWALFRHLLGCRMVGIGISYHHPDILLLSWGLRLTGSHVVMMNDTKYGDRPRTAGFELFKRIALSCYGSAIVAGARNREYFRFLGFRRRPVLPGYNTISLTRIRAEAGGVIAPAGLPFCRRDFIYVGRFVAVKNLPKLLDGYAHYTQLTPDPRRLVLIGAGPHEAALRTQIARLGLENLVVFTGLLVGGALAKRLRDGLALLLFSTSEPWGLVVNEAVALGLPVITSEAPGARDVLVRNLINGFVIERDSPEGLARAMLMMGRDEAEWHRMVQASHDRAWLGDTRCFADAVEALFDPTALQAARRIEAYWAELKKGPSGGTG